jgi:excinuclease UvrABC nuclease subunit
VRRRALLKAFGSVQGVREATAEQIATVPGFTVATAQKLLTSLNPSYVPSDS